MSEKEKNNDGCKKKCSVPKWFVGVAVVLVLALLAGGIWWTVAGKEASPANPTNPSEQTNESTSATEPTEDDGFTKLEQGISISEVSKYAGMYMEDGTNDPVSDLMMLIVRNDSDKDLQLARIKLTYSDATAEFEVTNLPAGQSLVALEKKRKEYTADPYQDISVEDVVFFAEPMSLQEDQVKIEGGAGYMNVTNISQSPLGLMYVYYKNSATDLLYGGITYRAKIEEGLQPGETIRVSTGHYHPDNCKIVQVQISEAAAES